MKLQYPVPDFNWNKATQLFGVNKDNYAFLNIPGHNGIDIDVPYGSPILAAHDGHVYQYSLDGSRSCGMGVWIQQFISPANPPFDFYGGVLQSVYWHMSKVLVKPGDDVKAGQVIGEIGNTGYVNPPPTAACPHCGTHLHFGLSISKAGINQFNDYKGYQDPVPLLFTPGDKLPLKFERDLHLGSSGNDVSWLQTLLKLEGFADDYTPVGTFGLKTQRDVILLQKKAGISPALGYVGYRTRFYLNSKYTK